MKLQSSYVISLIDAYVTAVPEVPIRFDETKYGIIVVMPRNFNSLPPVTRAVAYAEINHLLEQIKAIGINVTVKVGEYNV